MFVFAFGTSTRLVQAALGLRSRPCGDQTEHATPSLSDKHRKVSTGTCLPDQSIALISRSADERCPKHDLLDLCQCDAMLSDMLLAIWFCDKLVDFHVRPILANRGASAE
jgi:hypothetical protein